MLAASYPLSGGPATPSISIKPPSPTAGKSGSTLLRREAYNKKCRGLPGRSEGMASSANDASDSEDDGSNLLCPHYGERHRGKHYREYMQQKAARIQTIKEVPRPPLWRVPIVRQPLAVSVEEFNSAEPQYAQFVKALWSHAKTTVDDKEHARDFAESPVGKDLLPERCCELDEWGWRRKKPLHHTWQDRPETLGRPLSPTMKWQGLSWGTDAEGYENPRGSVGDLRSKGMSYESRFQLPTLSSLMKAKHAIFVKARDPNRSRAELERARRMAQKRRSSAPPAARRPHSPARLSAVSDPFEAVTQHRAAKTSNRLPSPSNGRLSPASLSPNGGRGSPRGSPAPSPRDKTEDFASGRQSGEPTNGGSEKGDWVVRVKGKGKCCYPEDYVRWKRERRRMKERLKRLRAGRIFTSDRPKNACTDCQNPSLWWDPEFLTEHLHAARNSVSDAASDSDTSSGSDCSSSLRSSSSGSNTSRGSVEEGQNSSREQQIPLSQPHYLSFPPGSATALLSPPQLMQTYGRAGGGAPVYAPLAVPCLPAFVGAPRLLHRRRPGSSRLSGELHTKPSWLCCAPERPPGGTNWKTVNASLASTPPCFAPPSLQQPQVLLSTPQGGHGQLVLQQNRLCQPQPHTSVQQPIQQAHFFESQLPGTRILPQTFVAQPPQAAIPALQQHLPQHYQQAFHQRDQNAEAKGARILSTVDDARRHSQRASSHAARASSPSSLYKPHSRASKSQNRHSSAPPAARHQREASHVQFLEPSIPSPATTSPDGPPTTPGGYTYLQQGRRNDAVPHICRHGVSPNLLGGSHSLPVCPGSLHSIPQSAQAPPHLIQGMPHGTSQMLQWLPQIVQGAPPVYHGPPLVLQGGLASETSGAAGSLQTAMQLPALPRILRCDFQQPQDLNAQPLNLAMAHQGPLVLPQQAAVVQSPLLQQPQTYPLLVQPLQHRAPLVLQQPPPILVQQQQPALVIPQQLYRSPVVAKQQKSPTTAAVQRPPTTAPEQKPAEPKPEDKPKTPWLWNCSVNFGAKCGSTDLAETRPRQENPASEQQPADSKQTKPQTQQAQGASGRSPSSTPRALPVSPRPREVLEAGATAAGKRSTETTQPLRSPRPAPSSKAATPRSTEGTQSATRGEAPHPRKYLQPPQPEKASSRRHKQQQPPQASAAPSPSTPRLLTVPTGNYVVMPATPAICIQSDQPVQQHQGEPSQLLTAPWPEPWGSIRGQPDERPPSSRQPLFKYLPFTFVSPKRNIICGAGKRIHSKEHRPVGAAHALRQQRQASPCCGNPSGMFTAGVACGL
ncbi:hypothetical protein cyc_03011 [Cyclospora cayetanensis]|uniref:Uncharacterized protein n=1 Tax=Cyclospora cayetanensis TaxID=88456 RepID=A0A1D3CWZ9_9EIME|nr:hypothetical protein cyc_03011 [Cyclospora cayetanensis]